jgi:hypothetical protein
MAIHATFTVESWDEEPLWEAKDGSKVTRATVGQTVEGDASGTGIAHWLMAYRADGTAEYTGIQLLDGAADGRTGTLVLHSAGTFDGTTAQGQLEVIDGTGELAGMSGTGTFEAPHGSAAQVELELDAVKVR